MKIWVCKNCGYKLTDIQYLLAVHDYGCPKCKESFIDFKSKII